MAAGAVARTASGRHRRIARVALALLLALGGPPRAARAAAQLPLTVYDQGDGLTSLSVTRLFQDREGFIWAGTEKGLYRFDGVVFDQVGAEQGFQTSEIVSIAEDARGRLWVASRAGLQLRDGHGHFGWVHPDGQPLLADRGQTLAPTADGGMLLVSGHRLWTLTETAPNRWRAASPFGDVQLRREPALGHVSAVYRRGDAVWFGCGDQLCRLRDGKLGRYGPARGVPQDTWLGFLGARDGSLWVRGIHSVRVLPPGAGDFVARDMPGNHAEVAASSIDLAEDRDGRVLTRTDLGFARWDGSRWTLYDTANGLPAVGVSALLADQDGTVWIGTYGRGVLHWSGGDAVENWTAAQGLNGTLIWSIARGGPDAIWVADDWGGEVIVPSQGRAHRWPLQARPPNQAHAVLAAADGSIWYFLFDGRVLRYRPDDHRTELVATLPFLVRGAYQDRSGRFWAYTLGGLYSVDAASGRVERAAPGLIPTAMCSDLAEDAAGRLWLTCSAGLFRYDGKQWARIHVLPRESMGGYENVAITPDGRLWLSSLQPGLLVGRITGGASVEVRPVDDALLDDTRFYFLRADRRGRLWAGGGNGVDVLDGGGWKRLSSRDGLLWDETNHGAFYADEDGTVWIGTPVGLSHVLKPDQLLAPRHIRPLLLSARYGGRELDAQTASLPSETAGALVLRFAVLGNSAGNPVRFRYRLSGVDPDWVETAAREVRYASLPPGSYRFELQAIDENQRSRSESVALPFVLRPPWWRTPWAYAAAALALLAAVALAWRWRVRVLVEHAQRLERMVATRTAELRQSLRARSTLLAHISHDLRSPLAGILDSVRHWQAGTAQRDYPRLIERSVRQQLELIDELLEFSRGELTELELVEAPGHLYAFLHDVGDGAALLAERQRNHLECRFAPDLPPLVKADFRRLRQVLMNLLGNAAKFTRDGRILFAASAAPAAPGRARLRFAVEDTGIGLGAADRRRLLQPFVRGDNAARHDGSGLGLAIVDRLLERMGSRLEIAAGAGGGSRFGFGLDLALAGEDELEAEAGTEDVGGIEGMGRVVLVVDDHAQSRDMLCDLLDGCGFETLPAADGAAALATLRRRMPDLILTDQRMDGMDGWRLLLAVRRSHPRLPVLLYSASPPLRPAEIEQTLAFDAVLLKPAGGRPLLEAIDGLLRQAGDTRPVRSGTDAAPD
jgi:signal transduction histidine kinase/ligand-binding sensor domain-containing protein/CheY-like chemotaxis protein